jgi:hypothetical protein
MFKGVVWSVRDKKTGLVIHRSPQVVLKNCRLRVSAAGRRRVLKEKRKNVHAGIEGELVKLKVTALDPRFWRRVEYNPYLYDTFVYSDSGEPVLMAKYVKLTETGCYVHEF